MLDSTKANDALALRQLILAAGAVHEVRVSEGMEGGLGTAESRLLSLVRYFETRFGLDAGELGAGRLLPGGFRQ